MLYEKEFQSCKNNPVSLCRVIKIGIENKKYEILKNYLIKLFSYRHTENIIFKYKIFVLFGDYFLALFFSKTQKKVF